MIVFELLINGKLVSSAGAPSLSVLSHTVTAAGILGPESVGTKTIRESYTLQASLTGLTSKAAEQHAHLRWHAGGELKVGDEVTVRIAERRDADTPYAAD